MGAIGIKVAVPMLVIFRLVAVFTISSVSALAQFFGLATSGDGSQVYFATPLRQKDTAQPDYGKLFRIDASGLQLRESREYQAPAPVPPGIAGVGRYSLSNAYDVQFASVSSDGRVTAVAARRDCVGDLSVCANLGLDFVTSINSSGNSQDYPDQLLLSANGKWAFGGSPFSYRGAVYGHLVNVATGEQTVLGPGMLMVGGFQVTSSGRPIADDGAAVFSTYGAVIVLGGSQMRRIAMQNGDAPSDAVIDAAGHTIVYAVTAAIVDGPGGICVCGGESLHVADALTGESALLAPDGFAPSMSDDGVTVLYISSRAGAPQAWVIHTDGSGDAQLTREPLGIARAIISGDGRTVYVTTFGGRLLRIGVASGKIDELIPRTPFLDPRQATAPGKLTSFTGEGLSDSTVSAVPPLPYSVDGAGIAIQGEQARILSIKPNFLTVLAPPNLTPTPYPTPFASLQMSVVSESPFAGPTVAVQIVSALPEFLRQSGNYLLAAHEDWSALVTADNPAHIGEVVHAYATGLGATSPAIPYGEPAPSAEPLARLVNPYRCSYAADRNKEVQILFQGLAPNLAGIFQLDWRVPPDAAEGDFGINCNLPGEISSASYSGGSIPIAPPFARQSRAVGKLMD